MMKRALKTTFLYIGTAIGAGFSSGREIALFFGDLSPLNVALSSVFMSMLCGLFLLAGKYLLVPRNTLVKSGIFISACISLCAMLAGGEYVLYTVSNIPMLGLILGICGAVVAILGMEKIKILNTVLVPLIIVCIAVIFFKLQTPQYSPVFSLSRPILYSGLDVLLGGVIVSKEGEKMSGKEILLTCILLCAFLFVILYMLQTVVLSAEIGASMPVLSVAERFGLKAVCGILIASAIFTTLVSSMQIVADILQNSLLSVKKFAFLGESKNRDLVVFSALLLAYPVSFFGFDDIVNSCYPFVSVCGVGLTAIVALKLLIFIIRKTKEKRALRSETRLRSLKSKGSGSDAKKTNKKLNCKTPSLERGGVKSARQRKTSAP